MTSEEHCVLTQMSARWLRRNGFGVVATEITVNGCDERPDAIGFRSTCSALVEVKVSRGDFLADRHKPARSIEGHGLGVYRFYMSPEGVVRPEDLPPGWGLLHARGRSVIDVVRPLGNLWPAYGSRSGGGESWGPFQHRSNVEAERAVLYSIALRQAKGLTSERLRRP